MVRVTGTDPLQHRGVESRPGGTAPPSINGASRPPARSLEEPMRQMIPATFDGEVFRPKEPVHLDPNTDVLLAVHSDGVRKPGTKSFIETALSLKARGPSDLSLRVDEILYGHTVDDDEE
jgi:hypothetical protein